MTQGQPTGIISSDRASEQTLAQVLHTLTNLTSAVSALSGSFDSDNVTVVSPTDFPDSGANTKLSTVIARLDSVITKLSNQLTVAVNGNVAVSNFPTTFPNQHSQPVTDAQLRAQPVGVSGPLTNAELRNLAVAVSGPLTDGQLRASAVPVSGPLTDTQLRASSVPVSGPLTNAQLRSLPVGVSLTRTLTERMLAKQPASDTHRLWFDVADPSFIYTAEALAGSNPANDAVWRGIRVTLDADGTPVGAVQVGDGFKWNDRSSFGGWA